MCLFYNAMVLDRLVELRLSVRVYKVCCDTLSVNQRCEGGFFMANNYDYDAYKRRYRKQHPEKVLQWRFKTYWKFCQNYIETSPAAAREMMQQVAEGR